MMYYYNAFDQWIGSIANEKADLFVLQALGGKAQTSQPPHQKICPSIATPIRPDVSQEQQNEQKL